MQSRTQVSRSERREVSLPNIICLNFPGGDLIILLMHRHPEWYCKRISVIEANDVVHLLQIVATLHLAGMDLWKYFINGPIIQLFSTKKEKAMRYQQDSDRREQMIKVELLC